jgi:hypothetical protein
MVTWSDPDGGTITKHRNHTYFEPTKRGSRLARKFDPPPDVNLTPPWKRAGNDPD